MTALLTAFRRLARLIAVTLVLSLALGPAAHAAVCSQDPSAAASDQQNAAPQAEAGVGAKGMDGKGIDGKSTVRGSPCQHSHCHQVAPVLPSDTVGLAIYPAERERPVLAGTSPPSSWWTSRLDRPPRV